MTCSPFVLQFGFDSRWSSPNFLSLVGRKSPLPSSRLTCLGLLPRSSLAKTMGRNTKNSPPGGAKIPNQLVLLLYRTGFGKWRLPPSRLLHPSKWPSTATWPSGRSSRRGTARCNRLSKAVARRPSIPLEKPAFSNATSPCAWPKGPKLFGQWLPGQHAHD